MKLKFQGAPDRTSHKKKPEANKTRQDVANEISKDETEISNSKAEATKKRRADDGALPNEEKEDNMDEEEENDEEENENNEEENENNEEGEDENQNDETLSDVTSNGETSTKRRKFKKRISNAIVEACPLISTKGIFIYFCDGYFHFANEEMNDYFSQEFFKVYFTE